jgi:hypothetical protein
MLQQGHLDPVVVAVEIPALSETVPQEPSVREILEEMETAPALSLEEVVEEVQARTAKLIQDHSALEEMVARVRHPRYLDLLSPMQVEEEGGLMLPALELVVLVAEVMAEEIAEVRMEPLILVVVVVVVDGAVVFVPGAEAPASSSSRTQPVRSPRREGPSPLRAAIPFIRSRRMVRSP